LIWTPATDFVGIVSVVRSSPAFCASTLIAAGGDYVHPALGARMVAADAQARAAAEADPLSDREREVLRLLALGHTNQEIAKQLYISVRTAETHRAHIMQKLGLSTRAELVRHAIAHGLLSEDVTSS
jgi:two-component system response regulator NreC